MINSKWNVLAVYVGDAVTEMTILPTITVFSAHPEQWGSGRFVFIEINSFLRLLEDGIIVVHIDHGHSHPGRGLLPHASVGLVHGRHGEGVAGLGLGVQLLGHEQHPRHGVYPEYFVSVAGNDLQQNLGIPPHVLVGHLEEGEQKLEFKTEEDFYPGQIK